MSYFYTISDLYYKDYSIKAVAGDNPNITDYRDSDKFNRHERYEVLSFINAVSRALNLTTKKQCRLVEVVIREKLPTIYAYDRLGGIKWMIENLNAFYLLPNAPASVV